MNNLRLRAWDKENKKMYFMALQHEGDIVSLLFGKGQTHLMHPFFVGGAVSVEISLSTLLRDVDDQEIYAGDMVAVFNFNDPSFRSEVVFENGAFGYKLPDGTFISFAQNINFNWENGRSEHIKKLGNIFENPELLKDKR
jgi:hypothetical protein